MPQAHPTKTLGSPIIELQSVDSTNNYARAQLKETELTGRQGQILHGTAYFAHEQFAGKGQRGNKWSSEKGANIAMSILLDPHPLQVSRQFQLSACVSVSLYEFFKKYAGDDCSIKWPNDLYWQDRKAGGVLVESIIGAGENSAAGEHGNWLWAIIGIGVNINQTKFPEWLPNPVSLKQITGKTFSPIELAKECCNVLDRNYRLLLNDGFESIYRAYNEHLYKRGQKIKLKKDNRIFEALLKEVTLGGKLVLIHSIEEEFSFGEIEFVQTV